MSEREICKIRRCGGRKPMAKNLKASCCELHFRQSISIYFDPSAFNGFLAFSWKQKNRRCFAGMQNTGDCKCKCVQVRWAIKLPSQRLRDVP